MKAKFIGQNYLTFKNGTIYDIETKCQIIASNGIEKRIPCLCVYDLYSKSWCPYSRLETMLMNWKIE